MMKRMKRMKVSKRKGDMRYRIEFRQAGIDEGWCGKEREVKVLVDTALMRVSLALLFGRGSFGFGALNQGLVTDTEKAVVVAREMLRRARDHAGDGDGGQGLIVRPRGLILP